MARDFDGVDDVITVADSASISVFSGNFTVGFWFYAEAVGSAPVNKGSGGNRDFTFYIGSETSVYLAVGNGADGLDYSLPCSLNAWHYVIAQRSSGATVTLYFNDMTTSVITHAGSNNADTGYTMRIGQDVGGGNFFNGRVANVIIYNRGLTEAERITCKSGANVPASGLMMYLPLTGTDSPELDISGNGNDGVVTGTTPVAGPPDVEEPSVEVQGRHRPWLAAGALLMQRQRSRARR